MLLPLGWTLNGREPAAAAEPPMPPAKAKIKLSINAWSYYIQLYKHLKGENGGMSLFDLVDECVKLDVDAVDPTGYFFPGYPNVPDPKFVNQFKRHAFNQGIEISGTGIRNDFATADKAKRNEGIQLAKEWIEVAASMGAPVIRVFAGAQPDGLDWDEVAKWMADALHECAEHGEKSGVVVGVQNHGGMLKSAEQVLKILAAVDSTWLGTIIDTGYFLTADPYADIARVIPHAVNWQVKELLKDRKGDRIDMHKLVSIIRASEYRGYVPVETLPPIDGENQYNAYERVPELLAQFRNAID